MPEKHGGAAGLARGVRGSLCSTGPGCGWGTLELVGDSEQSGQRQERRRPRPPGPCLVHPSNSSPKPGGVPWTTSERLLLPAHPGDGCGWTGLSTLLRRGRLQGHAWGLSAPCPLHPGCHGGHCPSSTSSPGTSASFLAFGASRRQTDKRPLKQILLSAAHGERSQRGAQPGDGAFEGTGGGSRQRQGRSLDCNGAASEAGSC